MKRSEINQYIREFRATLDAMHFYLPPFCSIPASEWKDLGNEYDEIRDRMLGWDITDFGSGDFKNTGLQLVTIRNGNPEDPQSKTYAEKIMLVREKQVTPLHFHWFKMEDIINRGGGVLAVQVWLSGINEELSKNDVPVTMDGITRTVPAGTILKLKPGESAIVMDDAESIFYAIMKDKEGKVPRKLKVGRFTMEDEPDPPKYITQSDLDNFKTELLDAIKGGNK